MDSVGDTSLFVCQTIAKSKEHEVQDVDGNIVFIGDLSDLAIDESFEEIWSDH